MSGTSPYLLIFLPFFCIELNLCGRTPGQHFVLSYISRCVGPYRFFISINATAGDHTNVFVGTYKKVFFTDIYLSIKCVIFTSQFCHLVSV